MVTKAISKRYYKGLPSQPPLIATTRPSPFQDSEGPEAYSILKELRYLTHHEITTVWDNGLAIEICRSLSSMSVNWTSLDLVHICNIGEPSGPAIVWIGVEFGALSFQRGSEVAISCQNLIESSGIQDCYVEIRESCVMTNGGNRFLNPVPLSNPTFTAQDPYTATLGIPISAKDTSWAEGTGGFYLSAGGEDNNIYLLTARHVVLPIDTNNDNFNNQEYYRENNAKARQDILVLGTSAFDNKLTAIDYEISGQRFAITDANERMAAVKGMEDTMSVGEFAEAQKDLQAAENGLKALNALHYEIATHWTQKNERVLGELIWAPPIRLSTEPGDYTLDLAIIKIDPGILDGKNYLGNTINIGNKYTRQEFMNKVYLHHTSPTSFKYPPSRLVTLKDQVPESALTKPPMIDANADPCLIVFKNGAMTGTTVGRAQCVSSYTRNYFKGQYQESREWPVISTDKNSGAFSAKGDSGACVADAYCRIGGIITGGSGTNDSSDITYVTPISFIMKVLHGSKYFKHAHLNPALT